MKEDLPEVNPMTQDAAHIEDFALTLPLPEAARQLAQQFASQQPNPTKAAQVRRNTLAVWVVNDYLQMMGIDTDLPQGDSWNAIARLAADVADLEVVGAGRLECRPVADLSTPCPVPPEVWGDRIGYVAVQIDESQRFASILGFTPALVPGSSGPTLSLGQIQPPEDLMDHLDRLLRPMVSTTLARASANLNANLNHLGQWLQGAFDAGWSAVDMLLSAEQLSPAYAFRQLGNAMVRRAKLIDVGVSLPLVIELSPGAEQTQICVQLHPSPGTAQLPTDTHLQILDELGAVFLEARATTLEDYLQLQFSGASGEQFQVQVSVGTASAAEAFVI
ncbi:MAG: hypothetical protein Fur0046_14840 [Cyanobacteria bacterium J069]